MYASMSSHEVAFFLPALPDTLSFLLLPDLSFLVSRLAALPPPAFPFFFFLPALPQLVPFFFFDLLDDFLDFLFLDEDFFDLVRRAVRDTMLAGPFLSSRTGNLSVSLPAFGRNHAS
jgi:hypothetical protein